MLVGIGVAYLFDKAGICGVTPLTIIAATITTALLYPILVTMLHNYKNKTHPVRPEIER